MTKYTYMYNGFIFARIPKHLAKFTYDQGLPIQIIPYKLRPGPPWHPESVITGGPAVPFGLRLQEFKLLHGRNQETGHYPAFYIPVTDIRYREIPDARLNQDWILKHYDKRYLKTYDK